jgi:4-amino-4-deoxy-L-arabinose transferase-like glycosyltransferase
MGILTANLVGEIKQRSLSLYVIMTAGLLLLAYLLFFNLHSYPAPWYDEGSHLHVAKNLALNGVYADYSSEGTRYFGPALGVGPTVMLPVALVFKLFGVSIPLARLVIVVYGILALLAFYALTTHLVNRRAALLAIALLVASPSVDFVYTTRTVLGEVPGLFFVILGLWLWFRPTKHQWRSLIAVGGAFGLACATKNQFAVILLPSLLLAWIADLLWYKQRDWRFFVIPGLVAGLIFFGWMMIVIFALGAGDSLSGDIATLRESTQGVFALNMTNLENGMRFLTSFGVYNGLLIPAALYGFYVSIPRNKNGQQWGTLFIIMTMGFLLFLASIGWPRYAFLPLSLTAIFLAALFYHLTDSFRMNWRSIFNRQEKNSPAALMTILALGLFIASVLFPLQSEVHAVFDHGSEHAYDMAQYLEANIPKDALVETWEQELGVLTDHRYHYPPQVVLAYSVEQVWFNGEYASNRYDFRDYVDPDYLVIGPFAKYIDLYPFDERMDNYQLVEEIGPYSLYTKLES